MGRLTKLKPTLAKAIPRVGWCGEAPEQTRATDAPWRKWYKTRRWKDLRKSVLIRDNFTCRKCGDLHGDTSFLVCHHTIPHRGSEAIFWTGPFETYCKTCHDIVAQKEEQDTLNQRGVWY